MHFWKDNKTILILLLLIPICFLWIDAPVIAWVRHFHTGRSAGFAIYEDIVPFVRGIGHGSFVAITAVVLLIIGKFMIKAFYTPGKLLLIAYIVSGIWAQLLKHLLGRARPRTLHDLIFIGPTFHGDYDSLPSGHTTVMFCIAYVFSYLYPKYTALFYCIAVIIGVERVISHSHFPSDILAGAAAGIFIGKVIMPRILRMEQKRASDKV
jgi:undecaprenyl-diphosphatase